VLAASQFEERTAAHRSKMLRKGLLRTQRTTFREPETQAYSWLDPELLAAPSLDLVLLLHTETDKL